jgi:exodeoxyribonuclease VII large subunit
MWRGGAQRLGFVPEDGIEVVASGKLTTFPAARSTRSSSRRWRSPAKGALLALLEKTRRRLEAEGLFASERKRPLPFLPDVIGVVTSPTGAVIRDILHRLEDRFPVRVLVWPVLVQGQGAAEQVAAAVRGFGAIAPAGRSRGPDLLIVARGGGSIEDLWAFNEEAVVRAIAESPIPGDQRGRAREPTPRWPTSPPTAARRPRPPPPRSRCRCGASLAAALAELGLRQRKCRAAPGRARARAAGRRASPGLPRPEAWRRCPAQRLDDSANACAAACRPRGARARPAPGRFGGGLSGALLRARVDHAARRWRRSAAPGAAACARSPSAASGSPRSPVVAGSCIPSGRCSAAT